MPRAPIISCSISDERELAIADYADALKLSAPDIGDHGMSDEEFWQSGLFRSAIEKIRGTLAATTEAKKEFVSDILNYMQDRKAIDSWNFSGSGERHDYEVKMPGDRVCVIETKGCLDGNNTNIFERPPNAEEFIIWSLCQNPGSDPVHNAWSGIHTRLSAEIIHRRQLVDGVIIWDMLCNTMGRPCPKVEADPSRTTAVGRRAVPPPCIYLMPKTVPDPRNNPTPPCHSLAEVSFLAVLQREFSGNRDDIVEVQIACKMDDADIARKTTYSRAGQQFSESRWTKLKRAR